MLRFSLTRPIPLDRYPRLRRKRSLFLRTAAACALLLTALIAKSAAPAQAEAVYRYLTGASALDRAVTAFYDAVSDGEALSDAVCVFFEVLDEEA